MSGCSTPGAGGVVTVLDCEVFDLVNTFKIDSICRLRYAYVFEETDLYGDTESWVIAIACE